MSDIFQALNLINLLFQGSKCNITVFTSKPKAFICKLDIWTKNAESEQYKMFKLRSTLQTDPSDKSFQEIVGHLKLFLTELMHYFPDMICCTYAVNLFCIDPAFLPVGAREKEEIIDIQADKTAKSKQKDGSPIDFRLSMGSTYPTMT